MSTINLILFLTFLVICRSHADVRFTTEPPDRLDWTNTVGATLDCAVETSDSLLGSNITVSWITQDGRNVNSIPGLRLVDGNRLIFPSFRADNFRMDVHSAVYTCVATFGDFGKIYSRDVQVNGVVIQQQDIQVYDIYVFEKNTAVFHCHIPAIYKNYFHVIDWIRNENLLIRPSTENSANSKFTMMPNGDLHIYNVSMEEYGSKYKCKVQNALTGAVQMSSGTGTLFVTEARGNVPPKMLETALNLEFNLGKSVIIPCVAQGNPVPTVMLVAIFCQWFKETPYGQQLVNIASNRIALGKSSLTIYESQQSDEGIYICKVDKSINNVQMTVNVTVIEKLAVKIAPVRLNVKIDERVAFVCEITGHPVNSIMWLHNGLVIRNAYERMLTIDNVQLSNSGFYQCFVRNNKETVQAVTELHLSEIVPKITESFKELTLRPKASVSLKCLASGTPVPSLQWTIDRQLISNNQRISIDSKYVNGQTISILHINNLQVEDGGLYSCLAANKGGKVEHLARLNVYGKVGIREVSQLIAVSDSQFHLNCPFYGYPFENIRWQKDEIDLPNRLKQNLYGNGTLITEEVDKVGDAGEYICMVQGSDGETVEGKVDVKVLVPPKIIPFEFQDELLREGMRARLQCVISEGDLPLTVTWWKDGSPITPDMGILVKVLDEFSTILTINHISPKHNGEYICMASNEAATVTHMARLSVNGMRAHVTCAISQGDLPVTFEWFKNGEAISSSDLGIITRKYDDNTDSLSIENVESRHSGNYTCVARNVAGEAKHTALLMVRVRPKIVPFQFGGLHYDGSPARVVCGLLEGDAPVDFLWLHNGIPVEKDHSDFLTIHVTDGLSSILSISKLFSDQHKGVYTCVAKNNAGADRHDAILHINAPKIVPFAFQGDHVFEGALARLTCVVYQGDLPLNITWRKDHQSTPIQSSLGVEIRSVDTYTSILTIDRVEPKHQGDYTCIAYNSAASASHTASLVIVPFEFKEEQLVEGQLARVSCIVSRGDLPLNFAWEKDGLGLINEDAKADGIYVRSFDEHSSILSITSVQLKHNGRFTCIAKNAAGMARHSAEVVVKVPPRWIQIPSDTSVLKNEPVMLHCVVEGFPKPRITWKRSMSVKFSDSAKSVRNDGNLYVFPNGSLSISKMNFDYEGAYYCQAANGVGKGLSRKILLKVNAPPAFKLITTEINVVAESDAYVNCSVRGDNPITITWYRQDKLIQDNLLKYRINTISTEFDGYSTLLIFKTTRNDSGNYTCRAENVYGANQTTTEVAVLEIPDAPDQFKATAVGSDSVELVWNSLYNGNSPIKKYLIEYKEIAASWDKAVMMETVNGHPSSSIVTQLRPYTTYVFRVYAENAIGRSTSSQILSVNTEEDAPIGLPSDVQVESVNTENLRVTWKAPDQKEWNGRILGYHIGYKEVDTEDPFIFKTLVTTEPSANNMFVHIGQLKQFTKYAVTVQCYNSKGKGPMTQPVIVMTSEGAPNHSPSDVSCTTLTSQSIHVTWAALDSHDINGILRGYKVLFRPASEWFDDFADSFNITLSTLTTLDNLNEYTNYSIQVLAMTKAGDGPKSLPVFCKTLDDAPSPPSNIKTISTSEESVTVVWTKPENSNGIIKSYTIYWRDINNIQKVSSHSVDADVEFYEVTGLLHGKRYEFWTTASTLAGESKPSKIMTEMPTESKIPTRIAAFDTKITASWKSELTLSCVVIANPEATRRWTFKSQPIRPSDRMYVSNEGYLIIKEIEEFDAGDYTCTARNDLSQDKVTYTVIVFGPPAAPLVKIISISSSSVEVEWKTELNKKTKIRGHCLHIRKDENEWRNVSIASNVQNYRVNDLECGNRYELYMTAQNQFGVSASSPVQLFSTDGSVPTSPLDTELIETAANSVALYLNSWKSNECPIQYFVVEYASKSSNQWITVSSHIKLEQRRLVIPHLKPANWYSLRMTAHNSAGSTIANYDFATLTVTGATISPDLQSDDAPNETMDDLMATLNFYVIIPISCTVIILLAIFAFACLWLKLKKRDISALSANRMSVVGSEIRRGNSSESFAYMQRELISRPGYGSHYEPESIHPYATLQLPGKFQSTFHRHGNVSAMAGTNVFANHQFIIPQGVVGFIPATNEQVETTFVFPPPPPDVIIKADEDQLNPTDNDNKAANLY
ncbi:Down syndrome cell adhesion molecule-like protein 1 [Chamberlinius hualienensis]